MIDLTVMLLVFDHDLSNDDLNLINFINDVEFTKKDIYNLYPDLKEDYDRIFQFVNWVKDLEANIAKANWLYLK